MQWGSLKFADTSLVSGVVELLVQRAPDGIACSLYILADDKVLTISHTSTEYTTGDTDGWVIPVICQPNIMLQMKIYSFSLKEFRCCKEKRAPSSDKSQEVEQGSSKQQAT